MNKILLFGLITMLLASCMPSNNNNAPIPKVEIKTENSINNTGAVTTIATPDTIPTKDETLVKTPDNMGATGTTVKSPDEIVIPAPVKDVLQLAPVQDGDLVATIKTSQGDITIKLFQKLVPHTVNNFIGLAQEGYYNNVIFHRVIENFMIQGGDPTGTGMGGKSIYGAQFNDEFHKDLSNIPYSLSMANSGKDTNGSQFFINQGNNTNLDYNKQPLKSQHSVFGQVVKGKDIIEKIAKVKTIGQNKPESDITILSITIQEHKKGALQDYTLDVKKIITDYTADINAEKEARKNNISKIGSSVSVHYTLTVEGKKVESSHDKGTPLSLTLGKGQVIPGWEKGLVGRKIGEKFQLNIEPNDAYGDANIQVAKKEILAYLGTGTLLEKGKILNLPNQQTIKILDSDATTITIKNPHEFAGKKLLFDIEVMDIK